MNQITNMFVNAVTGEYNGCKVMINIGGRREIGPYTERTGYDVFEDMALQYDNEIITMYDADTGEIIKQAKNWFYTMFKHITAIVICFIDSIKITINK